MADEKERNMKVKVKMKMPDQPYWIMEDGWWWQYVGSYKSNDGGKTWIMINQRWENDMVREREEAERPT